MRNLSYENEIICMRIENFLSYQELRRQPCFEKEIWSNWQKAYCARPIPCLEFLCNISSMRRSVSSPGETLRRELKIRRVAEYFWRTSRCFIWWWNTVSNAWYYFSNKMTLEGEIKDAKMAVFHLISKHSLSINFLCISFMNYQWVWEVCIIFSWFWTIQLLSSPQP